MFGTIVMTLAYSLIYTYSHIGDKLLPFGCREQSA